MTTFGQLSRGDWFEYDGILYVKTNQITVPLGYDGAAYDPTWHWVIYFLDEWEVERVV